MQTKRSKSFRTGEAQPNQDYLNDEWKKNHRQKAEWNRKKFIAPKKYLIKTYERAFKANLFPHHNKFIDARKKRALRFFTNINVVSSFLCLLFNCYLAFYFYSHWLCCSFIIALHLIHCLSLIQPQQYNSHEIVLKISTPKACQYSQRAPLNSNAANFQSNGK